jgi:hypothetical protein
MKKIYVFALVLLLIGCKDKYDIVLRPTDVSLLVVEGNLNAGNGGTNISLSKTVMLNDRASFKPVLKARLTVESKNGNTVSLVETGNNGNYVHNNLGLIVGQEYRLRIKTADSKEYLSDYVKVLQTPEIDSITWKRQDDGLMIEANSHDPSNNTLYYKWDYDETWEIRSFYAASYAYIGGVIVATPAVYHYRCWKYDSSHTINIASTAQLVSDVVSHSPLMLIPNGSEKLGVRYSILLRQQAIQKPAYDFLQLMKKNTESVGSIFDAQPSDSRGNIKCISNPGEGVIGFVTAATSTEKRIFITNREANWLFNQSCSMVEKVRNNPDSIRAWVPAFLPWSAEEQVPGVPIYYYMSPAVCVDCTARGGNLQMPVYW